MKSVSTQIHILVWFIIYFSCYKSAYYIFWGGDCKIQIMRGLQSYVHLANSENFIYFRQKNTFYYKKLLKKKMTLKRIFFENNTSVNKRLWGLLVSGINFMGAMPSRNTPDGLFSFKNKKLHLSNYYIWNIPVFGGGKKDRQIFL